MHKGACSYEPQHGFYPDVDPEYIFAIYTASIGVAGSPLPQIHLTEDDEQAVGEALHKPGGGMTRKGLEHQQQRHTVPRGGDQQAERTGNAMKTLSIRKNIALLVSRNCNTTLLSMATGICHAGRPFGFDLSCMIAIPSMVVRVADTFSQDKELPGPRRPHRTRK